MRAFFDQNTRVLKAVGAVLTNEDGDIAVTVSDDFSYEPGHARLTEAGEIEAYSPPTPVPVSVSRWDALEVLLSIPITSSQIVAAINDISDDMGRERARILFDRPVWMRDSDLLTTLASAFDLTSDDVDDLFIATLSL